MEDEEITCMELLFLPLFLFQSSGASRRWQVVWYLPTSTCCRRLLPFPIATPPTPTIRDRLEPPFRVPFARAVWSRTTLPELPCSGHESVDDLRESGRGGQTEFRFALQALHLWRGFPGRCFRRFSHSFCLSVLPGILLCWCCVSISNVVVTVFFFIKLSISLIYPAIDHFVTFDIFIHTHTNTHARTWKWGTPSSSLLLWFDVVRECVVGPPELFDFKVCFAFWFADN